MLTRISSHMHSQHLHLDTRSRHLALTAMQDDYEAAKMFGAAKQSSPNDLHDEISGLIQFLLS